LSVFQRTPAWIVPHSTRPIRAWEHELYAAVPATQRAVRAGIYWARELLVVGLVRDPRLLRVVERAAPEHLRRQVPDPALRARLRPHYSLGCKRILPSDDFYPAVSQPNVELVTDPIAAVTPKGIQTAGGAVHQVDTIVMATGFRVTDNPTGSLVHGRAGHTLSEAYTPALQAYLGTTVPYFPNLWVMTGPNTGLGHSSMVFMIESQLAYVLDALRQLGPGDAIEVRKEAADAYNARLQARLPGTVWGSGCSSWYLDAYGRNLTLWPGFTFTYRWRTRRFDPAHYSLNRRATALAPAPAPPDPAQVRT
jgi:cation diffusion facilitator CzcD-associated flavoprotein CzcO